MDREHEDYEDEAQINEEMRKKLPIVLIIAVLIAGILIGIPIGAKYLLAKPAGTPGEERLSFNIEKPKYLPGCGSSADVSDIVAMLRPKHPNHDIKIGETRTYFKEELLQRRECIGAVTIILTPKLSQKPATVGAETTKTSRHSTGLEEDLEYPGPGFGFWCKTDQVGAFTEKRTVAIREEFERKHGGTRTVTNFRIFGPYAGETTAQFCILYQHKKPGAPKKHSGTTLAFAGVFCFLFITDAAHRLSGQKIKKAGDGHPASYLLAGSARRAREQTEGLIRGSCSVILKNDESC